MSLSKFAKAMDETTYMTIGENGASCFTINGLANTLENWQGSAVALFNLCRGCTKQQVRELVFNYIRDSKRLSGCN